MFFKSIKLTIYVLTISSLVSCGGGNSPTASSTVGGSIDYTGVAQKGPLGSDSLILASLIDKKGDVTGNGRKAKMQGSLGTFSVSLPDDWGSNSLIQLTAEGSFLSESNGKKSKDNITLTSITNNKNALSINLLTGWAAKRTRNLLKKGKSFTESQKQAENELAKIFGIINIHELDISQRNQLFSDNAQLLLLSGAMMDLADKTGINPQVIINEIGSDFSENGQLNKQGDDWFIKMQAEIRMNPVLATNRYARAFNSNNNLTSIDAPTGKLLPKTIALASRPTATVPTKVFAKPSETIILDGSASHDSGNIINFTWFRVDQQSQYVTPFSDRFSATPSITVPNEESVLLYALVVTDEETVTVNGVEHNLTDTALLKVIVKEPPPENKPPVADGQNLETNEDTSLSIILTGSDPDDDPLDFDIKTPAQLAHGLLDGTPPNLTYEPHKDFHGTDSFEFRVSDGSVSSPKATVNILIHPVNDKPISNAGLDQTVAECSIVSLDGSASFDVEDGAIGVNGYNWTGVTAPFILLGNANTVAPTFIAPATFGHTCKNSNMVLNEGDEILRYQLTVFDSEALESNVDKVLITVVGDNLPPVANAGKNQKVVEGDTVILSGSGLDPEDGITTIFEWTSPIGVILDDASKANPTFEAQGATTLLFELVVKDSQGLASAPDTVEIIVSAKNQPPTADSKSVDIDPNSSTPSPFTLTGDDPDGDNDELSFEIVTDPSSGTVSLNGSTASYTPSGSPVTDSFTFRVIDEKGLPSAPAKVDLIVNQAPVIIEISDQVEVTTGTLVTLSGLGEDPEDGNNVTYQWTSSPDTSLGGTTQDISFTALTGDDEITQTFTLQVFDTKGLGSLTKEVKVRILPAQNNPPVATPNLVLEVPDFTFSVPISFNLTGSDPDTGDTIQYHIVPDSGSTIFESSSIEIVKGPDFINDGEILIHTSEFFGDSVTFDFEVIDNHQLKSLQTETVTIKSINQAPTAIIYPVYTQLNDNTYVFLDGGSNDPDDDPLTRTWSVVSPSGSNPVITPNADGTAIAIQIDVSVIGSYDITLEVSDGELTSTDTIKFVLPNSRPVADEQLGLDITLHATAGTVVDLVMLTGSDFDNPPPNPSNLKYQITEFPPSGGTQDIQLFLDEDTGQVRFKASVNQGSFSFKFRVIDEHGFASLPKTIEIVNYVYAP